MIPPIRIVRLVLLLAINVNLFDDRGCVVSSEHAGCE